MSSAAYSLVLRDPRSTQPRVTVMIETYYAREQADDLERSDGAGAVEQTESEWAQLIAMLELAQRWQELIGEFTA